MDRQRVTWDEVCAMAMDRHKLDLRSKEGADTRPFSAADILNMEFSSNPFMLENVFRSGELVILAGSRKTNKSFISLDILISLACGGALSNNIFAQQRWEVALIDAELTLQSIRDRLRRIIGLYGGPGDWTKTMRIVSLKHEERALDISKEEDRLWLEGKIGTAKVVVLDNFGKIIKHGSETCVKSWRIIAAWFERLHEKGITVILAHHENKTGEVRGTRKMEDDADLLISLKRPKEWTPADGNIVEVHFPAARHLHGDQVKPFTIRYTEDFEGFRRSVGIIDENMPSLVEDDVPVVSTDEVSQYQLSSLQVEMLTIARTKGTVRAGDVISTEVKGRGRTSVTNAFEGLRVKELLEAQGPSNKGRYYIPVDG